MQKPARPHKSAPAISKSALGNEGGPVKKAKFQGSLDEAQQWRTEMGYEDCEFQIDELVGYREGVYRVTNVTRKGMAWHVAIHGFDITQGKYLPGIETTRVVPSDQVVKMAAWLPKRKQELNKQLQEIHHLTDLLSCVSYEGKW